MAISLIDLNHKYDKANEALDLHGGLISDRLLTGNTTPVMLRKFNLMSAWISFMSDKLFLPTSVEGIAPADIVIDIPRLESEGDLVIGIENYKGRFFPIFPLVNSGLNYSIIDGDPLFSTILYSSMHFKMHAGISEGNSVAVIPGVGTLTVTDLVKISINQTSDFNGSPLIITSTSSIANDPGNIVVVGGQTPIEIPNLITEEDKQLFNNILEDIAIELKISYR